jgi:hypothetical protein
MKPTTKLQKHWANYGASQTRHSIVRYLRKLRDRPPGCAGETLNVLDEALEWIGAQAKRASSRPGGFGRQ